MNPTRPRREAGEGRGEGEDGEVTGVWEVGEQGGEQGEEQGEEEGGAQGGEQGGEEGGEAGEGGTGSIRLFRSCRSSLSSIVS
jgi:hypothetical protein